MLRSTVLFDLDGTLTDPGEGIVRCLEAALRSAGLPVPASERLRACIGPPLRDGFLALGARAEQVDALVDVYRARYRESGMFENAVYPGIPPLLERLRSAGCRLVVATSKPTGFAAAILGHFGLAGFFGHVFGSKLDGSLAHKNELLAHVRARIGFTASATAFVGDREFDIAAARAHEIYAIGALWGYGSRSELEAAGADRLVEAPELVVDALAG